MAEEEEMKVLVIILGILSAIIILGLLAFSFVFERDYQQPKEWDKYEEVKSKDDLRDNDEDRS